MFNKKINSFLKSAHPVFYAKTKNQNKIPSTTLLRVVRGIPGYPSLYVSVSKDSELEKPKGVKVLSFNIWTYDEIAKKGLFDSDASKY